MSVRTQVLPEGYEQVATDRDGGTLTITDEGIGVILQYAAPDGYQADSLMIPRELVAWARTALGRVSA